MPGLSPGADPRGEDPVSGMDWTRAAYVFFALALLAALAKLTGSGAALQSFVVEGAGATEAAVRETATREVRQQDPPAHPGATNTVSVEARQEGSFVEVSRRGEPPVFYRPAPVRPAVGGEARKAQPSPVAPRARRAAPSAPPLPGVSGARTGPVCGDLGDFPESSRIVFPLAREHHNSYEDSWGAARPQGGHEGTDLMVADGTPEYAVTDGTIVPVSGANGNGWNTLGGYTVMLQAAYTIGPVQKGDLFYYAHMNREATLKPGTRVRAGQVLGYAGDTGYGPEVTKGKFPPHLHFGWYDARGTRSSVASGAMNPFPLLEWMKANGGAVQGGSDASYCTAPQPVAPEPSGGGSWSYPSDPGQRPDMDTGSASPAPSPVAEPVEHSHEHGPEPEEPVPTRPQPSRPQGQTDVTVTGGGQAVSVQVTQNGETVAETTTAGTGGETDGEQTVSGEPDRPAARPPANGPPSVRPPGQGIATIIADAIPDMGGIGEAAGWVPGIFNPQRPQAGPQNGPQAGVQAEPTAPRPPAARPPAARPPVAKPPVSKPPNAGQQGPRPKPECKETKARPDKTALRPKPPCRPEPEKPGATAPDPAPPTTTETTQPARETTAPETTTAGAAEQEPVEQGPATDAGNGQPPPEPAPETEPEPEPPVETETTGPS